MICYFIANIAFLPLLITCFHFHSKSHENHNIHISNNTMFMMTHAFSDTKFFLWLLLFFLSPHKNCLECLYLYHSPFKIYYTFSTLQLKNIPVSSHYSIQSYFHICRYMLYRGTTWNFFQGIHTKESSFNKTLRRRWCVMQQLSCLLTHWYLIADYVVWVLATLLLTQLPGSVLPRRQQIIIQALGSLPIWSNFSLLISAWANPNFWRYLRISRQKIFLFFPSLSNKVKMNKYFKQKQ